MFSGIIKSIGKVHSIEDSGTTRVITISSPISESLQIDQSIAHDGVCLTIVKVENDTHAVEVVLETLSKTSLGGAQIGQWINLEKSISLTTLLDGHLVQGHVDAALICLGIEDMDGSWKMEFNLPEEFESLVIAEGSICLNGVSLTVSDISKDSFSVAIIPYTYHNTSFQFVKKGDLVNVEFDVIGKYINRRLELRNLME